MWCIPPKANAAFFTAMEQVLDVYQRPYDPRFPVICMDESNKQLIGEVQPPLPLQPGQVNKENCNYARRGTGNLFIAFEPARGQREVTAAERRTRHDWATYVKFIVDDFCTTAERITLVGDQLNTHSLASLHVTFEPVEALRLAPKAGTGSHAQTRQLAQYGRDCIQCARPPMSGSAHR